MQTDLWAKHKSKFGWKIEPINFQDHTYYSYSRYVPVLGQLNYLPNISGITTNNAAEFTRLMRDKQGFGVRLELYQHYDEQLLKSLVSNGWKLASKHIQYRDTVLIDLTPSEDDIFMSFKSRCRNEARKAINLGVTIDEVEASESNLTTMYSLIHSTSQRKKFFVRDEAFTKSYWEAFKSAGQLHLYFAKYNNEVLAGAVVLVVSDNAWYKDGGSVRDKGNLMGPRLLQWEIIKKLKAQGIKQYDLSGVPKESELESSSMRGIYTFKTGYSNEVTALMPTLELSLNFCYKLWGLVEKQWLRVFNLFAHTLWY